VNLMRVMPVIALAMAIGPVIIFYRQALGPLSTLIASITALAIIGVLGWFVIDYAH